jgi:transglutaminase-like putative cysteine protease
VIYRVIHLTEYRYADPVSTSHHQLCLSPRPAGHQVCGAQEIIISPTPVVRRERIDYFGNRCTHVEMQEPHRSLRVESRFEVDVRPRTPVPADSPPWEVVRDQLRQPNSRPLLDACGFTFESPHVQLSHHITDYARVSFQAGRPILQATLDLTARIHAEFKYDGDATTIATPVAQVMSHRRGVCQDFAHLSWPACAGWAWPPATSAAIW